MNSLLLALADVCHTNRFRRKVLVTNSLRLGHQVLETLAREGVPWVNLEPLTPIDLAWETAGFGRANLGFEMASDGQVLCVIEEALTELKETGRLAYFAPLEETGGLAQIIRDPLLEMRMAGIASGSINPGDFVDEQKGREVKAILEGYENRLREERLTDPAGVFLAAIDRLPAGASTETCKEGVLYLVPEHLELEFLPFDFLDRFTAGRRQVLPAEPVSGLASPGGFRFKPEYGREISSGCSYLFDVEKAPPSFKADLETFRAYGASSELKEVFRRIKRERIPLDTAVIYHPNSGTYVPLIHSIASALGVPVTFSQGIPAGFTSPGRLLLGLLSWMEQGYPVPVLYRLTTEGSFRVPSSMAMGRLLREASIKWNRDRYIPCLEALENSLQARSEAARSEGREGAAAYLEGLGQKAFTLKEIISSVLDKIPQVNAGGDIDYETLCAGLAEIVEVHAADGEGWDRMAKEAVLDGLLEAAKSYRGSLPARSAFQRLRRHVSDLRVGSSGFRPGHLHVASLRDGEWEHRPHAFVVGLESGGFPGRGLQDPVLLDSERERLSPRLMPRSPAPQRNIHQMTRVLASRWGKTVLSFPSFDPVEGRASFPSAVLLQAHRLLVKRPDVDYTEFTGSLEEPKTYFPRDASSALSEEEWWLSLVLAQKSVKGGLSEVRICYPHFDAGFNAEEERKSQRFTVYDGKVHVDAALVDPRRNPKLGLSATRIERLACCPFAYFLSYILQVEPPDEQALEPGVWLDPLTRGSLLHTIYSEYLRTSTSGKGGYPQGRALLMEIAEEHIISTKRQIPPPDPLVFDHERQNLLRGLEVFRRAAADVWPVGYTPLYFEVPFGLGPADISLSGIGLEDAVEIKLPRGDSVRLRGRIDCIDRTPGGDAFRVWDFKTGSIYGFDDREYVKQGRQIQHALYSLAAEAILERRHQGAVVREAGYIFPTEKGEGQRFARDQGNRGKALQALENMLDLLATGTFCSTTDKTRCTFCDYTAVCRYPHSVERMLMKASCPDNKDLEPWKELQLHE